MTNNARKREREYITERLDRMPPEEVRQAAEGYYMGMVHQRDRAAKANVANEKLRGEVYKAQHQYRVLALKVGAGAGNLIQLEFLQEQVRLIKEIIGLTPVDPRSAILREPKE